MTVLQALKTSVGYPLDMVYLERILLDRNISAEDEYNGISSGFMLAKADVYMMLSTTPNVTMDGFSITVADRDMLCGMAENIYRRYGNGSENITSAKNTVKDSSDIW
ncbi:MAG: hypothetical protein PHD21_05925 [Flavobacteriales bacterium]|nr:hypothetical protein [Flavobacteriales bacterium]